MVVAVVVVERRRRVSRAREVDRGSGVRRVRDMARRKSEVDFENERFYRVILKDLRENNFALSPSRAWNEMRNWA